ncbi:MAG: hypothetical protein HY726_14565 [Candidatus Rokubacteria bacterium]|nr:hypothetical protein [Candidatus Rokubacteria bacterium]
MTPTRAIAHAIVVLVAGCGVVARQPPDDLTAALIRAGLTWETLRFDARAMEVLGGDGGVSSPVFRLLHDRWQLVPRYTESLLQGRGEWLGSLGRVIVAASGLTGGRTTLGTLSDPLADSRRRVQGEDPLYEAIARIHRERGQPLSGHDQQKLAALTAGVPHGIAPEVALLLHTALEAVRWRDLAFRRVSQLEEMVRREEKVELYDAGTGLAGYDLVSQVDYSALFSGAALLGYALDEVTPRLARFDVSAPFAFRWESPLGVIVLSGSRADDRWGEEPYLLLVDFGGNDTYTAGGGATFAHPVSIVIDLAGNDHYAGGRGQFGSGRFGYGFLVDLAGDDSYSVEKMGLGSGRYGVGILKDERGSDRYEADSLAQGAGVMGIGILIDREGDDRYRAFQAAQGFGFVRGLGLLLDGEGNDSYVADDREIRYPSEQAPEHNASLSQGVGVGHRAADSHSLGGGIGILLDGGGDDEYSAGVFAQGAGYWYGMGLLLDASGNDSYQGVWYVQGAAAHFSVGALRDFAGQDRYRASHLMALGAGHDLALGFFMDDEGDDHYAGPPLSLGAGNQNGIGIFVELKGNDVYRASGDALGMARITAPRSSLRPSLLCIGLFLDLGGQDVYPSFRGGNGTHWLHPGKYEREKGLGVDGEYADFASLPWTSGSPGRSPARP